MGRGDRVMEEKKRLYVQRQIVDINMGSKNKPATITFALNNSVLPDCNEEGEKLLKQLMRQWLDYFEPMKVKGLRLEWTEEEQ